MDQSQKQAVQTHPHALPTWLVHVLEGEHRWGYLDAAPVGRTPCIQRRLVIYPPGVESFERRALKRHRDWPLNGAVVALFSMLALGSVLPPLAAALVVASAYAGVIWFSARVTRELRARSRRIEITAIIGQSGATVLGDVELFEDARAELLRLESGLERGELSPVDFEAGWGRVYNRVPARDLRMPGTTVR